jgi:hypothetical protein
LQPPFSKLVAALVYISDDRYQAQAAR